MSQVYESNNFCNIIFKLLRWFFWASSWLCRRCTSRHCFGCYCYFFSVTIIVYSSTVSSQRRLYFCLLVLRAGNSLAHVVWQNKEKGACLFWNKSMKQPRYLIDNVKECKYNIDLLLFSFGFLSVKNKLNKTIYFEYLKFK